MMEKQTMTIYWEHEGTEYEGFADFDGERIRYCHGTPWKEGETFEILEAEDCKDFPIEEVWEQLCSMCDEDGRLDVDINPLA